jgi:hypothetical protein
MTESLSLGADELMASLTEQARGTPSKEHQSDSTSSSQPLDALGKIEGGTSAVSAELYTIVTQSSGLQKASEEPKFFKKLPLELRVEVYKVLLANPIFGTIQSIVRRYEYSELHDQYLDFGTLNQYELNPVILRVCRQTYQEASKILYDQEFFVSCAPCFSLEALHGGLSSVLHGTLFLPLSPLTGYLNFSRDRHGRFIRYPVADQHSVLGRVRRWKLFISAYGGTYDCHGILILPDFCKAICDKPPISLKVAIIPRFIDLDCEDSDYGWHYKPYKEIYEVLRPLTVLRNVGEITFCDAELHDMPKNIFPSGHRILRRSNIPRKTLQKLLKTLIEGDRPVQHLYKMHNALVIFAQSFERYLPVKIQMALSDKENVSPEMVPSGYEDYFQFRKQPTNPCLLWEAVHPTERALSEARNDCDCYDDEPGFKRKRDIIVAFQEHQYRRISTFSANLNQFIKEEKKRNGIFDPLRKEQLRINHGFIIYRKLFYASLLLESYYKSFQRDCPLEVAAEFKMQTKHFSDIYSKMDREISMKNLKTALEESNVDAFKVNFKAAVDDMDRQYFAIQRAYKGLFKWDVYGDPRCNVVYPPSVPEEMVCWDKREPEITCKERSENDS